MYPSELPEKYKEMLTIFSEYEVFLTDQTSIIFIDLIWKKCKVINFE